MIALTSFGMLIVVEREVEMQTKRQKDNETEVDATNAKVKESNTVLYEPSALRLSPHSASQ